MAKSSVEFNRWGSREPSTWPFQVFQKYNSEFDKLFWSHVSASKYVYNKLGSSSAKWNDDVEKHFSFDNKKREELYTDLKDWSGSFNQFDIWVNLNGLMALSSNLETYMASVITLALESDPGVLFGASKVIDGAYLLKYGEKKHVSFEEQVVSCTKGDWASRINSYEKIFNRVPKILTRKLRELEAIRKLRNRVGHAFGRDIEEARKHGVKDILPMSSLSRERTLRFQRIIWSTAKSIDVHLLSMHIGEYQAIHFYHRLYPNLRKDIHPSIRAVFLKKEIGRFGAVSPGKVFCKGLVSYYESL